MGTGDSRPIKSSMAESAKKKHMIQGGRTRLPPDLIDGVPKQKSQQPPGAVNNLVGMFENKASPVPERTSPPPALPLTKPPIKSDKPPSSGPTHHKPVPLRPHLPTRVPPPSHIKPTPPPALHRATNGHGPQKQTSSESHDSMNQTTRGTPILPVFAKYKQKTDGPLRPDLSRSNVSATSNTTVANSSVTSTSGAKNPPRFTPSGIKASRMQEKLEKQLSGGGPSSQATEGEERQRVLRMAQDFSTSSSSNATDKKPFELAKHSFASQGKPPVVRTKKPLVPVKVLPMDKDREKENEQERERERERKRDRERERERERAREREREKEREREREREKHKAKKLPPLPESRLDKKLPPPPPESRMDKKLPPLPEQKLRHLYTSTPSPSTEERLLYENVTFPPSPATSAHPPSGNPSSRENVTSAKPTTTSTKSDTKQDPASMHHDYVNLEIISEPAASGEYANVEIMSEPAAAGEYANVEIMSEPAAGYVNIGILSSSDEEEEEEEELLFTNEAPGFAEEAIYENFGPDEGNRFMNLEELEKHVSSKGKKGLQIEYLKVKNEPLRTCYSACK